MTPQPPFNMLLVGMTGSGKTQFLLDMLETEYNRVFDYIAIVCPTINWNTTYLNWSHLNATARSAAPGVTPGRGY
jgi:septin family protein